MWIKWANISTVLRTKTGTQVFVKKIYKESCKIKALIISPLLNKWQG